MYLHLILVGAVVLCLEGSARAQLTAPEETQASKRSQTPEPPFPYRSEEISFENKSDKITLAGTLTLPEGDGPWPAVILVTGSGDHDRDETMMGHKPFLVIADYLTRRGVAVLRYDDRGTNQSTGDFGKSTLFDFATDAEAAVGYLQTHHEIDPRRIGVIGHSEGGLVGSIVAARNPAVAFLVLLAAPGASGEETALYQNQNDISGASSRAAIMRILSAMRTTRNDDALRAEILENIDAAFPDKPEDEKGRNLEMFMSPQLRAWAIADPGRYLREINVPVLALYGALDKQLPPSLHADPLRHALAHNKQAELHILPGLNHLFQTAGTGSMDEYEGIDETIAPAVLEIVGRWIAARK